jgi:hypothetical protein
MNPEPPDESSVPTFKNSLSLVEVASNREDDRIP